MLMTFFFLIQNVKIKLNLLINKCAYFALRDFRSFIRGPFLFNCSYFCWTFFSGLFSPDFSEVIRRHIYLYNVKYIIISYIFLVSW